MKKQKKKGKFEYHFRLKCPCCGTLVKPDRIGKDYDFQMYQIEFKGYKNIVWNDLTDTGNKENQQNYWIGVLKAVLKRLGYYIPKRKEMKPDISLLYPVGVRPIDKYGGVPVTVTEKITVKAKVHQR